MTPAYTVALIIESKKYGDKYRIDGRVLKEERCAFGRIFNVV